MLSKCDEAAGALARLGERESARGDVGNVVRVTRSVTPTMHPEGSTLTILLILMVGAQGLEPWTR